ncbi:hypothetical protein ISCGN_009364 [Ixodes scapularis]
MGRGARAANEPPPTGCNQTAILAALVLLARLSFIDEDSEEESDQEGKSFNDDGPRKARHTGGEQSTATSTEAGKIDEVDSVSDGEPTTEVRPGHRPENERKPGQNGKHFKKCRSWNADGKDGVGHHN